jgi:Transglycosylase SLT domain
MSLLDADYPGSYATPFETLRNRRASLKFTLPRWSGEWAMAALPPLARALSVAGLLAGVFVIAATGERPEVAKRAPSALRVARAPSPILTLAQDDSFPLDSDFSLDQAGVTWARRLAPGDQGDRPGTMRFGAMRVQRSIVERVVKAARTTGSDPALLMSIADKESSFASSAKASTSSASGLFQFVESTWLKALRSFGWRYGREEEAKAIQGEDEHPVIASRKRAEILQLRDDPYLSAALAAEMLKHDGAKISEHLGRSLTAGETYLIHFLGPEDAERFMTKLDAEPQASAARLLPRPARANKTIFYERLGRKMKDRSVSEVHEAFEHMMGSRVSRYQDVEAQMPPEAQAYAEPVR